MAADRGRAKNAAAIGRNIAPNQSAMPAAGGADAGIDIFTIQHQRPVVFGRRSNSRRVQLPSACQIHQGPPASKVGRARRSDWSAMVWSAVGISAAASDVFGQNHNSRPRPIAIRFARVAIRHIRGRLKASTCCITGRTRPMCQMSCSSVVLSASLAACLTCPKSLALAARAALR